MDLAAGARQWCLATFAGTREEWPFGPGTRVFKTPAGKMYALLSDESPAGFRVSLKLTPEEAEEALLLPFVRPAPYMARNHWVTVEVRGDPEWEATQTWIRRSWELVSRPASRGKRGN